MDRRFVPSDETFFFKIQGDSMIGRGIFDRDFVLVNPSARASDGDIIAVKANTGADAVIRDATELTAQVPAWLQADHDALTAKVLRKPERREITTPVQEQLIVELYSK